MTYKYEAIDNAGAKKNGTVDAVSQEVAVATLQKRGLIVTSIVAEEEKGGAGGISFFERVSNKDVVILSRQMATLFEAQVSALRVFRLLAAEVENPVLRRKLKEISDDLQAGSPISTSLGKHPTVFTPFYVNMVKAGEESGKLDETFLFLADYLDRTYEVTSKVKNALIYPAFIVFTFISVMVLMLTVVIPKISGILADSGQAIPLYTKVVLALSGFLVDYGLGILLVAVAGFFVLWRFSRTKDGHFAFDRAKVSLPYVNIIYKKLYLSRFADNMNTMLISGIPMVRALELTATVIGNDVYESIMTRSVDLVKTGTSVSEALAKAPEIPGIVVQMVRIGEETGQLGSILKTLANFYRREVTNAIDTMVDLIEPIMIVALGLGVGFLLASVLIPIYNISSGI